MDLEFIPQTCEWIHPTSDPDPLLAVSDAATPCIHIYSGLQATNVPIKTLDTMHTQSVKLIKVSITIEVIYFY